ncbi:MAG TPA: DUF4328 domain-containing protein [Paludibacteraceae bacterium]|nr:DUF4328 domain-containing protein [Paludibacteraceae bacterium]
MEKRLTDNSGASKAAIFMIWAVLVGQVAMFFVSYNNYSVWNSLSSGGGVTQSSLSSSLILLAVFAMILVLVNLISAITFIVWFKGAYHNIGLKVEKMKYGEGWAIGCWFVPILNFFRPYEMMNEIFEETNRFFSKKGKDISLEKDIVGIWWFAYIIINFVFNVIFRFMEGDSVDPDDQISFSITWMVYSIVMVPLALVTIRMIKNYAKAEKALYHFKEDEVKVESNVVETPQEKELESSVNKGIE